MRAQLVIEGDDAKFDTIVLPDPKPGQAPPDVLVVERGKRTKCYVRWGRIYADVHRYYERPHRSVKA